MKKKISAEKQLKNAYCEKHSNLALITTALAMISFVVLMPVYMGDHNPMRVSLALGASKAGGVLAWIAAAVIIFVSVKGGKKHLAEYAVYLIIMGIGLFFMYNMPMFVYNLIKDTRFAFNWARNIFKILSAISAVYFVVSVIWHVVLASPDRKAK
jgi:hypothetical protein